MNGWRLLVLGVGACCALRASDARAIGTADDQGEDIFTLGEIVVTGSRVDGIQAAETVREIDSEVIKKSSARTLDEAVGMVPGVDVRVGTEGVPRVNIRGFKTRHVLLLLDGVPMNSTFDQQFDPSLIPVDQIAKIKVTAGASSVLYGQGGLGGVINIVTKRGHKGFSAMVGAESGDGAPYLARGSISGGAGRFDYLVSGTGYRRDRFPLAKPFTATPQEAAGYRKNSDSTRRTGYANLGFTPSDRFYLALTGTIVQGGYGKPASAITSRAIENDGDPYASRPRFGRVDDYLGYTLQLAADYSPSESLGVRWMVYFNRMDQDNNQYDDETYTTFDDPAVPSSYHLRNEGMTRGVSIQPRLDLGRAGALTLGVLAEWDTWIDSGAVKPGSDGGSQGGHGVGGGSYPYLLVPVADHRDYYIYSAAAEYQVSPVKDLGLAGGFAYHWQHRSEADPHDHVVSASAYYDLFAPTRLKAAFQRNIRFPSLSQLYLRDSDNPKLAPERVYHYQVGIEQRLPWSSSLQIDGFRSDLHDFIALDQRLQTPKNKNYSLFRIYGVEASIETRVRKRFFVMAGYTYLHARDLSGSGMTELQYVPAHKATVAAKYDFDFGFTAFASAAYGGASAVYPKQILQINGKSWMNDYGVVSVKLTQKLFRDRLTLYAGADNVIAKNYEQSYGIPRPGRFIYGGFEGRFGS